MAGMVESRAPQSPAGTMNENDELVRAVAFDGTVRAIAARTTEVARALRTAHDAGPVGAVALSRLATATLLLGATVKGRQQVGIQINGDGPLGELYAISAACVIHLLSVVQREVVEHACAMVGHAIGSVAD